MREGDTKMTCNTMGGYFTTYLTRWEGTSLSNPTCNDVKQGLGMLKDHPDPEIANMVASADECCLHPVPTGAIVGGVLGGFALVGIGLAVRKKKAQRSDYAEMPK
jgi:hypothetical protein